MSERRPFDFARDVAKHEEWDDCIPEAREAAVAFRKLCETPTDVLMSVENLLTVNAEIMRKQPAGGYKSADDRENFYAAAEGLDTIRTICDAIVRGRLIDRGGQS